MRKSANQYSLESVFPLIRNGASIKQEDGRSGVPITRIETIADGTLNLARVGYADVAEGEYADYYLQEGDIMMSHINSWAHLGKSALVDGVEQDVIHGMNLLLLRADQTAILPKYAHYYFQTHSFKSQLHRISNQSVNQSSFAVSKLRKLSIPVPSLPVQREIAETLDKADALRRKDQEVLRKYDALAQSIFYEMFGDPYANTKGWEKLPLTKLGKVQTGNTPPRENKSFYGTHLEWIKTDNITHAKDHPTQAAEYLSVIGEAVARKVPAGSVLVTCIAGSLNSIGNAVLTDRKVAFNQQINSFTPIKAFDELFLLYSFRTMKRAVQDAATNGMKRLVNKSQFEAIEFIYPPVDLQVDFGRKLRLLSAMQRNSQSGSVASQTLFDSLLTEYFR